MREVRLLLALLLLACKPEVTEPGPADVVADIALEPAAVAGTVEDDAHRLTVVVGTPVVTQKVATERYELTVGVDLAAP